MMNRTAGILLHPSSLPGPYGIGDFGVNARSFLDRLQGAHQSHWQILPLSPPDAFGCPYSALSAFAINECLVDPHGSIVSDFLDEADLAPVKRVAVDMVDRMNVRAVGREKARLLDVAYGRWTTQRKGEAEFQKFCLKHARWLDDFALFQALSLECGDDWRRWKPALVERQEDALTQAQERKRPEIERQKFAQWIAFSQWAELLDYAHSRDIQILGDVPIFVAMASHDVWAKREIFQVGRNGASSHVAGVPPDYFSPTGQKWGNPLYDWDALKRREFRWWVERIKHAMAMFDRVRIDHFRGFESYWSVPSAAPTAVDGTWKKGPGDQLFDALVSELDGLPFVAEDLGMITDEVRALRDRWKLPGMKIMHFAFDGNPNHPFLPHTYPQRCVAYTGTHDNDTTRGWFDALDDVTRARVTEYLGGREDVVWPMIEAIWASAASLTIVPVQDLFELEGVARMNLPGTTQDNWSWRMDPELLDDAATWRRLGELTVATNRAPNVDAR
jgi:4-alpha-glucanotransferase